MSEITKHTLIVCGVDYIDYLLDHGTYSTSIDQGDTIDSIVRRMDRIMQEDGFCLAADIPSSISSLRNYGVHNIIREYKKQGMADDELVIAFRLSKAIQNNTDGA